MSAAPELEEVVERFLERVRAQAAPDLHAFAAQYPDLQEELERLLPLILQMEGCAAANAPKRAAELELFPDLGDSDFQILRKIGSGGMGVVYEALQRSLQRKVALKVLALPSATDPKQGALLAHEAHILARLHHPNIVKIYSAGTASGRCYYAMELIQGQSVSRTSCGDLRRIATIGLQTAQALAYAHSCNILHRDIKPANLLLDAAGDVHVSDFGLAFMVQASDEAREDRAADYGTLRYMAPERVAHGLNTFAADQYAFGATLYELVSRAPFPSAEANPAARKRSGKLSAPPLKCAEPDLAAIIHKCIATRPEDRYVSMDAVVADLQRFLDHRVVSAAPTSPIRRFRLWIKRKPAVAALSFLGAGLFLAFGVALAVGYLRVNAARKLAEETAASANTTLADIFYHIAHQTPTTAGAELLARLIPHYQTLAQQQKAPVEQLINANQIVGTAALRSGEYAIAEGAFRNILALQPGVAALRHLGEALQQQGKTEEARAVFTEILDRAPDSGEAIIALQALERTREAFHLLHQQRQARPDDPELRFLYAKLLGRHGPPPRDPTRGEVKERATDILNALVEEYPDRPEYAIALLEISGRQLRHARQLTEAEERDLASALAVSYRLLGRYPNTPGVVKAVVGLHRAHVMHLHRTRQRPTARTEIERLRGMLEILAHNPEVSDAVKELLQTLKDEPLPAPPPRRGKGRLEG